MSIILICSEFNRSLVERLHGQAHKQFEVYKVKACQALSKYSLEKLQFFSDNLKNEESLKFIQRPSELEELLNRNLDKQAEILQSFLNKISHLYVGSPLWVPGAGEIPLAVQWAMEYEQPQAVLALGVIIRGQTTHYDFLCNFLERSLWDLQKTHSLPIIFSVLMVENEQQAEERIERERGAEGMKSLIQMIELRILYDLNLKFSNGGSSTPKATK